MTLHKAALALLMMSILVITGVPAVSAFELSGHVALEARGFLDDPLFPDQKRDSVSLAVQPEVYYQWKNGSRLTFTPFARIDSSDPERSHFDIREFQYLMLRDGWELRIGIGKVFWGVTEFLHLVDIINQTDLIESIDAEEKLGQPMVHLSIPRGRGVLDLFVLPYFRERTFPGRGGRLRSRVAVDTGGALYENSAREYHTDLAVRYSHTAGDWDFGVYHFHGTGREPELRPQIDRGGNLSVIPFYLQINQTGIDLQAVKGNWLLKLESIYRTGQGESFGAFVGGFEYSVINIASSNMDLGLIGEWAYDERGDEATTVFDNDLMTGIRLALNDAESTGFLIGHIRDLDGRGSVLSLESSRRLRDNWKLSIDAFLVLHASEGDPVYDLRDDDSVQLELSYYF